jgi:hypothetical protein
MTEENEVRFWSKVDRSGGPDACWNWQACTVAGNPDRGIKGYGVFHVRGTTRTHAYAHRTAWELANGPIPAGLFICHHCDNPLCCNPAHLFAGTALDNVRDMIKKGRQGIGNTYSKSKLSADQIRAQFAAQEPTTGRTFMLRVRLTEHERVELFATAAQVGQEVSAYVRALIFAEQPQPTQEAWHEIPDRNPRPC